MPILQDATAAAPAAAQGQMQAPNPEIVCPAVKAHMDEVDQMLGYMDEAQRSATERIVMAGKKMLYSPESREMVKALIFDDEVPMKNKLGEGVANLMVMMSNASNDTMPKELLVPAGVIIMFEAADYVFECGFDVSEEDLAGALELLVYGIFQGFDIPQDKVDELIDDIGGKMGFKEGDANKVAGKVEEAQAAGVVREPIEGDTEEAAFQQGFNSARG